MLEERDHSGCYGKYHLRGDVHQVDGTTVKLRDLRTETSGNLAVDEVVALVQRLVSLCYMVLILLVRGQVNDLVKDDRIVGLGLVDLAVRRLDKTVFVDPCIGCKGVDQTDVRTFGGLDRAHTTVVRIVDVSNLETCTVTRQTAGTESGKTSLVGQLAERVVLIHKL